MSARSNLGLAVAAMMATVAMVAGARADGDPGRGGQLYRTCVACHPLAAGSHLTGPSLAGLWQGPAGQVEGFARYSAGLRSADFDWDAPRLVACLRLEDRRVGEEGV